MASSGKYASGPTDLHGLALEAERCLEQFATALGHAGVDPQATAAVAKMADVMRKIVSALGQQAAPAQPPQPRPTIGSATDQMMAARAQGAPPAAAQ